jgi:hypothetical protein
MSKQPNDKVEKLLDEMDNYRQTVGAILALGTILIRYYDATFRVGRKLNPSPQNRVQNHDEITPDILAQGKELNLIGEVKKSFPQEEDWWLKDLKQIEKYDDDLTNWVNDNVKTHDLMLLTHLSRSVQFKDFVEKKLQEKAVIFERPLSIVEFVRNSERHTFWTLRKAWGNISNNTLNKYLTESINLRADNIVSELSSVWFYDSEPEVPYTMSLIWGKIFPDKATMEKFREAGGKKIIELIFTIDEIVEKCKQYFSMPDSSFPQKAWIIKVMDGFVKLKRAKNISGETYTVYYHKIGTDMLETFAKEWIETSGDIRKYFPLQQKQEDTNAKS